MTRKANSYETDNSGDDDETKIALDALHYANSVKPKFPTSPELNKHMTFSFYHEDKRVSIRIKRSAFSRIDPLDKMLYAVGHGSTFATDSNQLLTFVDNMLNIVIEKKDLLSPEQKTELLTHAIDEEYLVPSERGVDLAPKAAEVFDKGIVQNGWRSR